MANPAAASLDHITTEDFPVPIESRTRRLESIDVLRGLLMLLMALDHTREFFGAYTVGATNPQESWPALYITRWITHLCAPGFIALAGASVYLQRRRGKTPGRLSRLLATRGLWLMFLEVTLISFGWFFYFPSPFLQVIWATGLSMVGLSALMRFSTRTIGGIGWFIILFHNLLDPIHAENLGRFGNLWKILHESGMFMANGHPILFAFYPVVPWFGVICLGYAFGPIAMMEPAARRRVALILSSALLAAFAVIRLINHYGDDRPYKHFAAPIQTLMSFFNVEKYPPSLDYVLATFGVLLLLYTVIDLAVTHARLTYLRSFLQTYGRVPFFYYTLHIYLIHGAAVLGTAAMGLDWHHWIGPFAFFEGPPPGWGLRLPGIYAVWLAVILALYLPCLWFSRLKARRSDWWLSYL